MIRAETAGDIYDLDSFSKFSGKLVPISPINAQYNVIRRYQKANPDNHIDLQPSIDFNIQNYTQDLSILLKYNTFLQSVICSLNLRNIKWLKKAICAH